ncbi:MAG: hypothetical protein HFH91_20145 [Lachnospiraceae bacterium]|nr:hypothetical protein [Lachnospiraceae bacterium]
MREAERNTGEDRESCTSEGRERGGAEYRRKSAKQTGMPGDGVSEGSEASRIRKKLTEKSRSGRGERG